VGTGVDSGGDTGSGTGGAGDCPPGYVIKYGNCVKDEGLANAQKGGSSSSGGRAARGCVASPTQSPSGTPIALLSVLLLLAIFRRRGARRSPCRPQ
jgi:MYXO-CTERM domain-containing protein